MDESDHVSMAETESSLGDAAAKSAESIGFQASSPASANGFTVTAAIRRLLNDNSPHFEADTGYTPIGKASRPES